MAKFLQETIHETALEKKKQEGNAVAEFSEFVDKVSAFAKLVFWCMEMLPLMISLGQAVCLDKLICIFSDGVLSSVILQTWRDGDHYWAVPVDAICSNFAHSAE